MMTRKIKRPKPASKKKRQARKSGGSWPDKIHAYLNIHAHALFFSLGRLIKTPFTSAMTIAVLAIAIALASGFYVLVQNAQQLTGNIQSSNQISIFLKIDVTDHQGEKLAARLRKNTSIQQVDVISKKQALDEFKLYSGFGDALSALHKNPLPTVLQVLPDHSLQDKFQLQQLLTRLQQFPEVDFAQMDMQWVQRLQSIMQLAQHGVALISLLLACAVLFITGNTIRLELQNRRDEVLIAKLVGATHAFIQRPFLYSGFWYGFLAGFAAWLIVTLMLLVLKQPVEKLSALYDGSFTVLFMSFKDSLLLLCIASALGVLGAWMVLIAHLQQIKPE